MPIDHDHATTFRQPPPTQNVTTLTSPAKPRAQQGGVIINSTPTYDSDLSRLLRDLYLRSIPPQPDTDYKFSVLDALSAELALNDQRGEILKALFAIEAERLGAEEGVAPKAIVSHLSKPEVPFTRGKTFVYQLIAAAPEAAERLASLLDGEQRILQRLTANRKVPATIRMAARVRALNLAEAARRFTGRRIRVAPAAPAATLVPHLVRAKTATAGTAAAAGGGAALAAGGGATLGTAALPMAAGSGLLAGAATGLLVKVATAAGTSLTTAATVVTAAATMVTAPAMLTPAAPPFVGPAIASIVDPDESRDPDELSGRSAKPPLESPRSPLSPPYAQITSSATPTTPTAPVTPAAFASPTRSAAVHHRAEQAPTLTSLPSLATPRPTAPELAKTTPPRENKTLASSAPKPAEVPPEPTTAPEPVKTDNPAPEPVNTPRKAEDAPPPEPTGPAASETPPEPTEPPEPTAPPPAPDPTPDSAPEPGTPVADRAALTPNDRALLDTASLTPHWSVPYASDQFRPFSLADYLAAPPVPWMPSGV